MQCSPFLCRILQFCMILCCSNSSTSWGLVLPYRKERVVGGDHLCTQSTLMLLLLLLLLLMLLLTADTHLSKKDSQPTARIDDDDDDKVRIVCNQCFAMQLMTPTSISHSSQMHSITHHHYHYYPHRLILTPTYGKRGIHFIFRAEGLRGGQAAS